MTLVFRPPPLWWDKLGFAQFHAVQCLGLSLHFLLGQRPELQKTTKIGSDGKRINSKRLLLDAWKKFQRRATSWPPPFFIILVSLAEVATPLACEPRSLWLRSSRRVGLITGCLSGSSHPSRCSISDAVCFIFQGPLFCFSLLPLLSVPLLLNVPTHRYAHRGFSWLG